MRAFAMLILAAVFLAPTASPARADADLMNCAATTLAASGHGEAIELHHYLLALMADPMFVQECMTSERE